jgi:hypothetical protein
LPTLRAYHYGPITTLITIHSPSASSWHPPGADEVAHFANQRRPRIGGALVLAALKMHLVDVFGVGGDVANVAGELGVVGRAFGRFRPVP